MLEAQNRRIDDLVERIRLQQEKLDKQNVRIRTLQSQVRKRRRMQLASYIIACVFYQLFNIFYDLIVDSELFPGATVKTEQQFWRFRGATRLTSR